MSDLSRSASTERNASGAPNAAPAADDAALDSLVARCLVHKALAERGDDAGSLARRIGIGGSALCTLLLTVAPDHPLLVAEDYVPSDTSEEQTWVRNLLLHNVSTDLELSRWLAAILARRAMEANHLWEDLGLPNRGALSRMLQRHFAPLVIRNVNDMRWKRFFFRVLCEDEGLVHCSSPTCSACVDVDRCFEPGSAEAMIARAKQAPA